MAGVRGVAAEEVAKFSRLQQHWWNPTGPLRSLHLLNPIRTQYINNMVKHYGKCGSNVAVGFLTSQGLTPQHTVLDVGCGGGILSESLARLGGTVTGIDACAESIEVAKARQQQMIDNAKAVYPANQLSQRWESRLQFQPTSLFDIVEKEKVQYDVVVASEVIEHVSDARGFLQALCEATKPGGLLILSSMDKSIKTAISHILFAERITGIVDPGTHDWSKFVPPQDVTTFAARFGVRNVDLQYIITYPDLLQSVATFDFQVNFALSKKINTGHYFWTGVKASHTTETPSEGTKASPPPTESASTS